MHVCSFPDETEDVVSSLQGMKYSTNFFWMEAWFFWGRVSADPVMWDCFGYESLSEIGTYLIEEVGLKR